MLGLIFFLVISFGLSGCQKYQSNPLTPEAVDQALAPPSSQVLRIEAKELAHPILKPISLNLSDGLSPDEVAVLAVLVNPTLRVERDRLALANAQVLQAKVLPNPQLSGSFDTPVGGTTAGTVNAFGVGLGWDVTELISRSARVQEASSKRAEVQLGIAWQEWQVAQAAKTATYRLVGLRRRAVLAAEIDKRLTENLELVRRAVRAGQMTERELAAAETASNQGHKNLLELQIQARQQGLTLIRLLGLPPETDTRLEKGIKMPSHLEPPLMDRLLKDLERRRLDLAALRRGYQSEEAAVRAAILEQFPRINIGVNQAGDTGGLRTLGFSVSISLPIFDRNQGKIAIERATRKILFDEYVNRVFQARSDIAALLATVQSLNKEIEAAEAAEPSLVELVGAYRDAWIEGQVDVLSYYASWNSLTEKRLEILALRQQLVETRIALELATGLYQLDAAGKDTSAASPRPPTAR